MNGGQFKDYVRIAVAAAGMTKTYIKDDVFRPVPTGGSSAGDVHTLTGPNSGDPVGFANGKNGSASVFRIN